MSKKNTILMLVALGVCLAESAFANSRSVPDAGSSAALLGASLAGLVGLRAWIKSKR